MRLSLAEVQFSRHEQLPCLKAVTRGTPFCSVAWLENVWLSPMKFCDVSLQLPT